MLAVFCNPLLLSRRELVLSLPMESAEFSPHFVLSVGNGKKLFFLV